MSGVSGLIIQVLHREVHKQYIYLNQCIVLSVFGAAVNVTLTSWRSENGTGWSQSETHLNRSWAQPQIARRRRSASGYKRQIATSGPPSVSRWLAGGTFPLLADVGPPSAGHRRPTIGLPLAGHRRLATVVPTMSAILKILVLRLSQGALIFWL